MHDEYQDGSQDGPQDDEPMILVTNTTTTSRSRVIRELYSKEQSREGTLFKRTIKSDKGTLFKRTRMSSHKAQHKKLKKDKEILENYRSKKTSMQNARHKDSRHELDTNKKEGQRV